MEPEEKPEAQEPEATVDPLDTIHDRLMDSDAKEPAKEPAKPASELDDKGGDDKPAGLDGGLTEEDKQAIADFLKPFIAPPLFRSFLLCPYHIKTHRLI